VVGALSVASVGSLVAGAIAERWGAPVALGLGGVVCVVAGLATAITSPTLRLLPAGTNVEIAAPKRASTAR
jgi:hypothetical protein